MAADGLNPCLLKMVWTLSMTSTICSGLSAPDMNCQKT